MFKPIRSVVETIVKIAPFCILTRSLRLVLSSLSGPLLNGKVCGYYLLFFSDNQRRNKDEEHQHGIFFDDEYDYLQHLKPRTNLSLEPLPDNVTVIETKKPADQFKVLMTHYCFEQSSFKFW